MSKGGRARRRKEHGVMHGAREGGREGEREGEREGGKEGGKERGKGGGIATCMRALCFRVWGLGFMS